MSARRSWARSSATHTRKQVVERLLDLLHQAADAGCDLVVYPELALTTFFPRWFVDDITEADHWYERVDADAGHPAAVRRGRAGSASASASATPSSSAPTASTATTRRSLVERDGSIVATLQKVHIPGHEDARAGPPVPARRALLLRARPRRLRRVAGLRRPGRDDDLQRPALARDATG